MIKFKSCLNCKNRLYTCDDKYFECPYYYDEITGNHNENAFRYCGRYEKESGDERECMTPHEWYDITYR